MFALAYLHPQDLAQTQPDRAAQQSFEAVVQATLSRRPVLVRHRLAPLGFTMRPLTDHLITSTKRLQLQQLETACEQLESRHGRLEVPAQMADKTSSVILKVIQ